MSGRTGNAVGNPITVNIDPGQTATVSHAFQTLGVDISQEDTIIVTAAVTSGSAAIEGLVSQVDSVTHDGAAFEMSCADF